MAEGDVVSQVDQQSVAAGGSTTVDFRPSSGTAWAMRFAGVNASGGQGRIRIFDFTNSATINAPATFSNGGPAADTTKRHLDNTVAVQVRYNNDICNSLTYNSGLTAVEF